jgi:LCP family protein required for cell wall assembly
MRVSKSETGARRVPFRKLFVLAVVALVAIVSGYLLFAGGRSHTRMPWSGLVEQAVPSPQSAFGKDAIRVLVVGLDYDYDQKDQETSAHSRSDVIMALKLDFAHKRVYELSVPRDMVATLPNGSQAKINQAQSDGGIDESKAVVARFLGISPFDRYVILRIDTMKDIIDAIGGVDVTVKASNCLRYGTGCRGEAIDYDDSWGHLHVHLTEGMHHLSGEQAVGYARFRHDWCSDPCRIMRQQDVVKAIVQKLKGNAVNTFVHAGSLVGVVGKDVQTDFRPSEELSVAYALRDLGPRDVVTAQVPYVREVNLPNYGDSIIADDGAKAKLVRSMLGESSAQTAADPPPASR